MKTEEFKFNGDVNAFVMAMLSGRAFKITDKGATSLEVIPTGGLRITPARNGERVATLPVKIPSVGIDVSMSFQYRVEDVQVADATLTVYKDIYDNWSLGDSKGCKIMQVGRPRVMLPQFKCGSQDSQHLTIKFE